MGDNIIYCWGTSPVYTWDALASTKFMETLSFVSLDKGSNNGLKDFLKHLRLLHPSCLYLTPLEEAT